MEITQFTYFQEVGSIELDPITVELTYGLERIAMYIQGVDSIYDLMWSQDVRYYELYHDIEVQFSTYNFEVADVAMIAKTFEDFESECQRLLDMDLVWPAYDYCMKTSHLFNLLDARGAISVAERTGYIARVRGLARRCAEVFLNRRSVMGFPLLSGGDQGRRQKVVRRKSQVELNS